MRAKFPRAPAGATSISPLLEDRSGTIWITTNAGVPAIDGNALKPGSTGNGLTDRSHVWHERDRRVCTLAARQGQCLDQGNWRARGGRVENLPDGVAAVFPDRDGNLGAGVSRRRRGAGRIEFRS